MSIFAPVYRPTKHQQTLLARRQKAQSRKRKRGEDSSEDEDEDGLRTPTRSSTGTGSPPRSASTDFHPVNKTDPYHIAGHPREKPLPPPPFPHAAVKSKSKPKVPIDEELAGLNPPLCVPSTTPQDKSTSLKRRHADNLTTVWHRCMLNGDWQRASRAWALLVRTEIAGRGFDVRRHGRWAIGAELLMRQGVKQRVNDNERPLSSDDESRSTGDRTGDSASSIETEQLQFSDEGFKLAREYYERLILQYPHTPRTQSTFNATAVYPALFNIWIYEVQDRAKRAQQKPSTPAPSIDDDRYDAASNRSSHSDQTSSLSKIRNLELEQAMAIAQRMDDVMLSPPYDSNSTLLQLRGMVALWIADLHATLADLLSERVDDHDSDDDVPTNKSRVRRAAGRHRNQSGVERQKAKRLFGRLAAAGVDLPEEVVDVVQDDTE